MRLFKRKRSGSTPQTPSDIGYLVYDEVKYPIRDVAFRDGQLWLTAGYTTSPSEEHGLPEFVEMSIEGVDGGPVVAGGQIRVDDHVFTAAYGGALCIVQPIRMATP